MLVFEGLQLVVEAVVGGVGDLRVVENVGTGRGGG